MQTDIQYMVSKGKKESTANRDAFSNFGFSAVVVAVSENRGADANHIRPVRKA